MIDEIKVGIINAENIPHAVLIDRLNKLIRAQNAEGGMVASVKKFCSLIGKKPGDVIVVIRFRKID
jgi:hypothetical protein